VPPPNWGGGRGRGKGGSKGCGAHQPGGKPHGPPVTVSSLQAGELVDVFHRYMQDPNGYFMVSHSSGGVFHPSVGRTDGWTEARVSEAWDISRFNPGQYNTWVEIQWTHPKWYNRRGHRLDVNNISMVTQRVMPDQIRQRYQPSEAQQQPQLTLFHIRWGGEQPVNPVTEGAGGWGQVGSTPSDNYINTWEDTVYQALGPTYEIISAFYQGSEDLAKISAPLLRQLASGLHLNGLYFMWPIAYQDGHNYPAYVDRVRQLELMVQMEAAGIPTRFPHNAHLYRIFASKEWTTQMCLHLPLHVPLTTAVPRSAIICNPGKAAANAIRALANLNEGRAAMTGQPAAPVQKGVAKLGWSWEAMDVRAWTNSQVLSDALAQLVEQPGSNVDLCFVQEWVDFDVEMRHFIVEPSLNDPQTWRPKKIVYTVFKSKEGGSFRDFDRYERQGCLQRCFFGDDAALSDAERQAEELIGRWLLWFQAQTSELPTVIRFDILAKRLGPGRAHVTTGEVTELGGCFLGWPQGPQVVMSAMLRSCFNDPEAQ